MSKSLIASVRRATRSSMLCLPALLLAACGGGGGGGDGSTTGGTSTATAIVITTENAKAVAADAVEVAADGGYAEGATSLVLGAELETGSPASVRRIVDAGRRFMALSPAGAGLATGVAIDETMPCDLGGTLRFSGNVSDSGFSAGDTLTYTASACKMGMDAASAVTLDGSMSVTLHSGDIHATTFPMNVSMSFSVDNFTVSDASGSETVNGDMRIDLTMNSSTSESMKVSGGSLSTKVGGHSAVLKDYTVTLSVSGGVTTQTVAGTVETTNTRLGSGAVSYTIATVTPFSYDASGSVTAGVVKVTGNGSAMLVTVTGTDSFKLEVDANNDGGYESTLTSTRSELEALL